MRETCRGFTVPDGQEPRWEDMGRWRKWWRVIRNDVPHVSDIDDGSGVPRPGGVRHEVVPDSDPAFVLVREVWYWSATGEIRHADERRMAINDLVHLVVNTTEGEKRFFAEARTTWPDRDWDGVPGVSSGA